MSFAFWIIKFSEPPTGIPRNTFTRCSDPTLGLSAQSQCSASAMPKPQRESGWVLNVRAYK